MADPISLLAIGALVYGGRKMSEPETKSASDPTQYEEPIDPPLLSDENEEPYPEVEDGPPIWQGKQEMASFAEIAPQSKSSGQEVLAMRGRFDASRHNNLSPVEKQLVGPGLGLQPDQPASGGFQQMYRVNPVNVGSYRLTTLPGRAGPADGTITGGRGTVQGGVGFNRPETTAYLPERLPPALGKSQGFSGRTPRAEYEKTKRITHRATTGYRNDGLDKAPARRFIPAQSIPEMPTRHKGDGNSHMRFTNQPQPGISSFHGAYVNNPAAIRPHDKRGMPNRMGNPGRMNVRETPTKQGGKITSVRMDQSRMDGRFGTADGGWMQDYKKPDFSMGTMNAFKGNANPLASDEALNIAKRQHAQNPCTKNQQFN